MELSQRELLPHGPEKPGSTDNTGSREGVSSVHKEIYHTPRLECQPPQGGSCGGGGETSVKQMEKLLHTKSPLPHLEIVHGKVEK